jgi:hypothetical protein
LPAIGSSHPKTPRAKTRPTPKDLAWAAGFLEGEGHFSAYKRASIEAGQKRPETLRHLQALFGGRVTKCKTRDLYLWRVYSTRARGVMLTLYGMMSRRRQAQIRAAL